MPDSRLYTVPGTTERVPSVTTILAILSKPELDRWYRANGFERCDELSREARALGTALHAALEAVHRGAPAPCDEPVRAMVAAYLDWREREVDDVLAVEQAAHCGCGWRYAGTVDVVYRMRDGEAVAADFKTSARAYPEYGLQLAAYRHALRCSLGLETSPRRLVLRFDKARPGLLEPHWFEDDEADWRAFAALSVVWWRLYSGREYPAIGRIGGKR